jgi:putative thioredoxin
MARAGLAQVSLLARLSGKTLADVRHAAASHPDDLAAQLDVADLDLSGGHIDDAFERLLAIFPAASAEDRNVIRLRLLELFDVVGAADPRVVVARGKLTNLLF